MSGIGFWELIILFLIGLIVLGPERLPRVANQVGTWLGQARRMTRVMRRQLEEEIDFEKELQIKPDSSKKKPSFTQPEYVSRNEDDDTYSPAHDRDEVGTGVEDEHGKEEEEEDTDVMPVLDNDEFSDTDVIPKSEVDIDGDDPVPTGPAKEKSA